MAKFATYVTVMAGLMLLFYFGGVLESTPSSVFLSLLLNPEDFQDSNLNLKLVLAIEGAIASAIIVGFAATGNIELGIMSSFAIFLLNLLWDFISVFSIIGNENPVIAILLFSPVMMLYMITLVEWWRGVTT